MNLVSHRRLLIWVVSGLMLAACGSQQGAVDTTPLSPDTPNEAMLGATPTRTPRPTLTPSPTRTPTLTSTPAPPDPTSLAIKPFPAPAADSSADGRYLVYAGWSLAKDVSSEERNQIYLYDTESGEETVISTAPNGDSASGENWEPSISADGRSIVFWSFAKNLAAGMDNEIECNEQYIAPDDFPSTCGSVYVYDVPTREIVERIPAGASYGLGLSIATDISGDGRFVAFSASHAKLRQGAWLYDRVTKEYRLIYDNHTMTVELSEDAKTAAFIALDIYPPENGATYNAFLYDVVNAEAQIISKPVRPLTGFEMTGLSYQGEGTRSLLELSDDGRYLAFSSNAPLTDDELPGCETSYGNTLATCVEVYLYDQQTKLLELVSMNEAGDAADGVSEVTDISGDGRFVAFRSWADNLVDQPITCGDIGQRNCWAEFIRDRETGRTFIATPGWDGGMPNGTTMGIGFLADERSLVFISEATNLTPLSTLKDYPKEVLVVDLEMLH